MTRRLFQILGRRALLTFGLVACLVGGVLASIHLTSRYALKQYVEYQLDRIPWDVALYQKGPTGGVDSLRAFVEQTPGITRVASLAFLRARFPEGGEVQAKVDGTPLNTPWLSVLAASDLSLLPPQLGFALSQNAGAADRRGAVLALVGPEFAIGKALLGLQGARQFTMNVTTLGTTTQVFETPVRQVVRLERDELNRWLMDQTGSVSYVPVIGTILLMPYDWDVITKFDFVANGIVPPDLSVAMSTDQAHVQQAEYAPELVYLARLDRSRLISGWDIPGSLARVGTLNRRLHADAALSGPDPSTSVPHDEGHRGPEGESADGPHPEKFGGIAFVVDSTTEVLLDRMQGIARSVGIVSLLVALPLLWMAWALGANLAGLLMLNERRRLGLLRLRGVEGRQIGRVLIGSVAVGGLVGGAVGLTIGAVATLLIYENGRLPLGVLTDSRQLGIFAGFLLVTIVMALLVCRRFVRYATRISPLEATKRVSGSESTGVAAPTREWWPAAAIAVGSYVLVAWIAGVSLTNFTAMEWAKPVEQVLYFLGLPMFVYGVASWLSGRGWLDPLMAPILCPLGGRLGWFAHKHLSAKPHRAVTFLLIVALMSSVSLYPSITSGSFEDKATRGARVQIGADWQVLYNTPDLVDATQLSGPSRDQLSSISAAATPVLANLGRIQGVTAVTYLVEALLPDFYLPGYGLRGVPLYILNDAAAYQAQAYHEPRVGVTADFAALISRVRGGEIALSQPVADFWQLSAGTPLVVGLNRARQAIGGTTAGVLAFLPGMPPKTLSDRQGYVQARIDYLNYLLGTNAYLVSAADNAALADLQLLIPRIVVLLRTAPGVDAETIRREVTAASAAPPLEIHGLDEERQKVGHDMYISLALANMRIYLVGGLLLALVAILAIATANYVEDRRTLA
ncbi:MAG: FtsX-like permease family protein, partial [Vicinamibacterales bacterium]